METATGTATKELAVPAWVPDVRFEAALVYAVQAHAHQARKGGTIPYLAHLLAVTALVIEDGGTEDETIAALLHDAGEDQGGEARMRDIADRFGKRIADIVRECSDTLEAQKPPREQRMRDYIAHLPSASPEALRVSLADKVHNARSMAADYAVHGNSLWERFSVKEREPNERYYRELSAAFKETGASPRLIRQLDAALDDLFAE